MRSRFVGLMALAVLVHAVWGCGTPTRVAPSESVRAESPQTVQVTRSDTGVVVSDAPVASRIGADVLRRGGNAADAAVATAFALAVAWPEAGNLGGGGFMLIVEPGEAPAALDFRETAPAAATADIYTPGEDRHHARHAGVPGSVAGLQAAHQKYGSLPWAEVVTPAARLARDGLEVDAFLAGSINRVMQRLDEDDAAQVAELKRLYGKPGGGEWQPGDTMRLPDLADTLDAIAQGGADALYVGLLAERFQTENQKLGGIITMRDLRVYEAKWRTPTHARFRGHDVYGMPPPSSGGVCVALILQMLEPLDLRQHGRTNPLTIHLMAEAMRRAFHQRALRLGDPDFVDVPVEQLTGAAFAHRLGDTIHADHATPSAALRPAIPITAESDSTTHFSVADADGMVVACTTTLEQAWGSRVVLPGLGFVLNNEMGDFNWVAGRTTTSGAIGTAPNLIEPGKRMLSSMSPTLVLRDGKPVLVTGSPGGRTIINTVACITLNVLEFGMPIDEAVQAPRMHHQWLPDQVRLELPDPEQPVGEIAEQVGPLEAMGHEVSLRRGGQGSAHTIGFDPDTGEAIGVADFRRGGAAVAP